MSTSTSLDETPQFANVSSEPTYCFSTVRDTPYATHLLVYMAQKLKGRRMDYMGRRVDFVGADRMGGCSQWSYDAEEDEEEGGTSHTFELGEGTHTMWYADARLSVRVTVCASDEIQRPVIHSRYQTSNVSKQIYISGLASQTQMQSLMKDASNYVAAFLRQDEGPGRRVTSHVYDAKERQFVRLGLMQARDSRSLFMKQGEREALFGVVEDFLQSKADYEKCSVPYKLNILLHGLPGTGKTTVIKALASHFGLNVAVIPFSPKLTDDALAHGLMLAGAAGSRIIALEDVDCVFESNRKPGDATGSSLTLSGLLNCMDGMLRSSSKGLIMILTANVVEKIDEAVLRTARMDIALEFSHADKFQTESCFKFYSEIFNYTFTEQEWSTFWEAISCHRFSTALLQQFFFQARKDRTKFLEAETFKRMTRRAGKEGMQQSNEKKGWFYT